MPLLAGCGARSGLDAPDGAPRIDGAIPIEPAPHDRLRGVWRFHTLRALCDTLALAFCDEDVRVRLSTDDLCDGGNPIGAAPSIARVTWLGETEARLGVDFEGEAATLRIALREARDPRDDELELVAADGAVPGFPWTSGVRDGTLGARLPPGFIGCE